MDLKTRYNELQEMGPELKAYIHQQLAAFEPYILSDSNLQFLIEKVVAEESSDASDQYVVTLLLSSGGAQMTSRQVADNVYDAVALAKEGILERIYQAIDSSTSSVEHAEAVNEIKYKKVH